MKSKKVYLLSKLASVGVATLLVSGTLCTSSIALASSLATKNSIGIIHTVSSVDPNTTQFNNYFKAATNFYMSVTTGPGTIKDMAGTQKNIDLATTFANKVIDTTIKISMLKAVTSLQAKVNQVQFNNYFMAANNFYISITTGPDTIKDMTSTQKNLDLASSYANKITDTTIKASMLKVVTSLQARVNQVQFNNYFMAANNYYRSVTNTLATYKDMTSTQKGLDLASSYANKITDTTIRTSMLKSVASLQEKVNQIQFNNYCTAANNAYMIATNAYGNKDMTDAQNNLNIASSYANKITDTTIKANMLKSVTSLQEKVNQVQVNNYFTAAYNSYTIANNTYGDKDMTSTQYNLKMAISFATKVTDTTIKANMLKAIAILQYKVNQAQFNNYYTAANNAYMIATNAYGNKDMTDAQNNLNIAVSFANKETNTTLKTSMLKTIATLQSKISAPK